MFYHEDDERRNPGRHGELRRRIHAHGSRLSLALRERYLDRVLPIATWAREHVDGFLDSATGRLRELRVRKTGIERRNFKLAKRCIERAAAAHWREADLPTVTLAGSVDERGVTALLDPKFVSLGLDELEKDEEGEQLISWTIDSELALVVIGDGRSLRCGGCSQRRAALLAR